jgi:hypothetical protein
VNPVVRTPEGVRPLHLNQIVLTVDSAGEYLGQCAEFCGTSHAIMRMMAVALEPGEYDAWVAAMQAPGDDPAAAPAAVDEPAGPMVWRAGGEGHDVFMRSTCIACHAIAGTRAQGRLGPDLTMMGERFSIGAGLMANTLDNMTEWILHGPPSSRRASSCPAPRWRRAACRPRGCRATRPGPSPRTWPGSGSPDLRAPRAHRARGGPARRRCGTGPPAQEPDTVTAAAAAQR